MIIYSLILDWRKFDTSKMVDDVLYYALVLLTLLPVYLLFKLLQWMGWELFVNN